MFDKYFTPIKDMTREEILELYPHRNNKMRKEMVRLATKEAIELILDECKYLSKYALAKSIGVNPIMINNYTKKEKSSRMRQKVADKIKSIYSIEITDVYGVRE